MRKHEVVDEGKIAKEKVRISDGIESAAETALMLDRGTLYYYVVVVYVVFTEHARVGSQSSCWGFNPAASGMETPSHRNMSESASS